MEQILSDIRKLRNKLSGEVKQEIEAIEEKIRNLIGKEMEAKELRKELVDLEYKLYQVEEKVSGELAEEIFKIKRKIAKLIVGIGYIHGV